MNSFWVFIVICGIIISIAQKNQAKQRRRAHNDESGEDSAQNDRAELERQIREIFGEKSPQGENPTSPKPQIPVYTQPQSVKEVIKPKKATPKSAPTKAAIAKAKDNKPQAQRPKADSAAENSPIEAIIDDFSMEKAVIYSEIIHPKWEEF